MGAKVKKVRNSWTVVIHHNGRRTMRAIGPTADDKTRAEGVAEKVNASITLGQFGLGKPEQQPLPCEAELKRWIKIYGPTLKPTTKYLFNSMTRNHLGPHFGSKDMREIRQADLMEFVAMMQAKDKAPATIKNNLSFMRTVFNALIEDERLTKNPAKNLGKIMRNVQNAAAKETMVREAWTHEEASKLIGIAWEHEPRFAPFLELLFATGMRRGEAMGLKWADIDFESRKISIRRSITNQGLSTPKSGKSRQVVMTPRLAESLFDLLGERQRERITNGWPDTPEWVFCSEAGSAPDARNVQRVWYRVRRRATKQKIRPLPLHSARHSWATWAIQAGKNIRWVADQLGHADASTTLNHYAHAMREDDEDLSFADLGGDRRRNTATLAGIPNDENEESANYAQLQGNLARPERLERSTPSSAS